jgi:hypothetical protein
MNETNTMSEKFEMSRFLASIRHHEQLRWAVGDALLIECGPPDQGDSTIMREVAAELRAEGFDDYKLRDLAVLRKVSYAFPPASRRSCSWDLHKAAETPEFLDAMLAGIPKEKLTRKYMETLRKAWARCHGHGPIEGAM